MSKRPFPLISLVILGLQACNMVDNQVISSSSHGTSSTPGIANSSSSFTNGLLSWTNSSSNPSTSSSQGLNFSSQGQQSSSSQGSTCYTVPPCNTPICPMIAVQIPCDSLSSQGAISSTQPNSSQFLSSSSTIKVLGGNTGL